MNFDGFKPVTVERFGSLVDFEHPTVIPPFLLYEARNLAFGITRVRTRYGLVLTAQTPTGQQQGNAKAVTGLAGLRYMSATQPDQDFLVAFDKDGKVYFENPSGSGTMQEVTGTALVTGGLVVPPAGAYARMAVMFNNIYMAFGDFKRGTGQPAVLNGATQRLEPLGARNVGEAWVGATAYAAGELVAPTVANGHLYRSSGGTSAAAQPVWPLTVGATVVDGSVTWTETTPAAFDRLVVPAVPGLTRVGGAGTWAAARDVYVRITLVNGSGETDISGIAAAVLVNTVLNDRITVTAPTLAAQPLWEQGLVAPFVPTGYNVYVADVATGAAAPLVGAYLKSNGGAVALGANYNIDAAAVGAVGPTTNTAYVVAAGNVCAGQHYFACLFENNNGYITGLAEAAVMSYTAVGSRQVFVTAPLGPANTRRRIFIFAIAASVKAGPYFYIPKDDSVEGVTILKTTIEDNVTTSARFNFDDNYLKTGIDATEFFNNLRIPKVADVVYDASLNRMVYCGADLAGYEQAFLVSFPDDPEHVSANRGIILAATGDGERAITWREWPGHPSRHIAFKDRSAYDVGPDGLEPAKWSVNKLWSGKGPSGPAAVDVGADFLAFAHRSGAYVWSSGEPLWVSKEIAKLWSKINWKGAGEKVVVKVDDENHCVHFLVPFGNATENNLSLTMWFPNGLDDPYGQSSLSGKLLSSQRARRWSVDDIHASSVCRVERILPVVPDSDEVGPDHITESTQLVFGSSDPDGAMNILQPGVFADNGTPILWAVGLGAVSAAGAAVLLGGIRLSARGNGSPVIEAVSHDGAAVPFLDDVALTPKVTEYNLGMQEESESWRIRFASRGEGAEWIELSHLAVMVQVIASAGAD